MVRWKSSLLVALLLLAPLRISGKIDEDQDDELTDEDGDDNDEDEPDDASIEKNDAEMGQRQQETTTRATTQFPVTRTTIKLPLECYVCTYKVDSQIKSCLDPTKHSVRTITCHTLEDKCHTTVMTKKGVTEAMVRGCRSNCTTSPETTCCESNRCNNQVLAMPVMSPRVLTANKTTKSLPTTVVYFVTILLVLQTVIKVAFV